MLFVVGRKPAHMDKTMVERHVPQQSRAPIASRQLQDLVHRFESHSTRIGQR